MEDAEDEGRNAERAEAAVKAALSKEAESGTTTIGFGDASTESAAAAIPIKKANNISNLVRKRKTEVVEGEEVKKAKTEAEQKAGGDSMEQTST